MCLPKSKNYELKICLGELSWETGKPAQGVDEGMENFCRWNRRIFEEFTSCHQGMYSFPYVFVYLMDGKTPICFWKGDPNDYTNKEAEVHWIPFQVDAAMNEVKDQHMAGIFSLKLYFQETHKGDSFDAKAAWKPPPKR
jgi:hypothetical protein